MYDGLISRFLRLWLRKFPQYYTHREDLEQELRLTAWRDANKFDPNRGRITTYLFLRFRATLSAWRVQQGEIVRRPYRSGGALRGLPTVSLWDEFDIPTADNSHDDTITIVLARLPERDRYIVSEVFLEGRSQTELAAELGVSKARIGQIVSRSLERLSRFLS